MRNPFRRKAPARRLHIGGKLRTDGWEVLDIEPGPHVDHVGDASDLHAFAEGTFEEIYASHVLEHLDYSGALQRALAEWHRVLAPGGTLRVSVPDLDVLAELLLPGRVVGLQTRFDVMRMLFGGHTTPHDYHLVGLNEEFLSHFLAQAGYAHCARVERHGLFVDSSELAVEGRLVSLSMTARKRA